MVATRIRGGKRWPRIYNDSDNREHTTEAPSSCLITETLPMAGTVM